MSPVSFWITMAFAFAMLIMTYPFTTGCPSHERSSLLDFKGGLIDLTGRLSSWQGYNCCHWKGVVCDSHSSHVITLDLQNRYSYPSGDVDFNKSLSGKIQPSLFNLHHLQHLDLGGNRFNDIPISPQFAKLKRLTFLSLSWAGFGGEIPLEVGNITTLRHLDLSASFYGLESRRFAAWIKNLRSLEYLSMGGVNLTMTSEHWGDALNSLSNLSQIDLSNCGLSGTIPSLLNLTLLSHLHLSSYSDNLLVNSFPFPLPDWFQNVSSLVSLHLSGCDLNGSIPTNFLHRSRMSNIKMLQNKLTGNLSFIVNHSSSLTVFSLRDNSIGGVIPPSIANFPKLQKLDLLFNNFTGDIPPFGSGLGPLPPLSFIDLRGNELNGSIPLSYGRLSSLTHLYLNDNLLNGHIPPSLGQLPVLRVLQLENNQLSGAIPDTISKLVRLQAMRLSSNNLTGSVSLFMFQNLTQLQILDLSANHLTVEISPSWVPQFDLENLGLGSCNIQGDFPEFLSSQYSLGELDLSDNKIEGNVPSWLWDLPSLVRLNLSNNQLQGSLPSLESNSFEILDLHNNSFHGPIPANYFDGGELDLSNNKFNGSIPATKFSLVTLSLSGNNLSGGIPHSIWTNANFFLTLDLSKNSLRDVLPADLGRCYHLTVLNLAQNDLHGEMPEELGNLTKLEILNLNGNKLQGIIPSGIRNCDHLQLFDIGHNQIRGSVPVWLRELTQLKILSFTFNKFEGSIPPQLFELQNLQILDLSHNYLSGTIPRNLGKLSAMVNQSNSVESQYIQFNYGWLVGDDIFYHVPIFVYQIKLWIKGRELPYPKIWRSFKFMDLSQNKLSGDIPPEMGLLEGLIALNISRNNLSGLIPKSLGGMVNLESLDLSGNMLSGKIPPELVSLTFLSVLNLSDNMLSGLIPQGKQFSTFEASSFLGNPNLHGFPLGNGTQSSGFGERGSQVESNSTAVADADEMDRWWAVGVGLSYGVGFAAVIAVLCFHVQWRKRCFAVMDGILAYLGEG